MNLKENLKNIERSFDLVQKDIPKKLKSKHWNIFLKDFKVIFTEQYDWKNFLNNQEGSSSIIFWGKRRFIKDKKKKISLNKKKNLIKEYKILKKKIGYKFIKELHEGKIGNPRSLKYENLNINFRDIRTVYHAARINQILRNKKKENIIFLEIGSGIGLLSVKLKKLFPNSKIISIDLPEVNCLQQYYHSQAFPKSKIFNYQLFKEKGINNFFKNNFDFAFLPPWAINSVKNDSIDMTINIHSMMEMNVEVVDEYMKNINRIVKKDGFFYCVNRYMKNNSNRPIKIKDYKFDKNWYFTISKATWQQYWIHELLAVRTHLPNVYHPEIVLADLHPNYLRDIPKYLLKIIKILKNIFYTNDHRTYPNSINIILKSIITKIRSFLKLKTRLKNLFN